MYGDQFFIRDPETFKLFWADPNKVMKVIVNESEGKNIEAYYIRDMDLNLKDLVATSQSGDGANHYGSTSLVFSSPLNGNIGNTASYYGTQGAGASQFESQDEVPVDANNVIQLSLSEGMDSGWPFGSSVLEKIYKIYKQKELLEDSVLIYRVHRAPERRVFFIDVGTMPPNKAQQYLERIRYEVQQKRIPSRTGGGSNIMDSTYSPMCLDLDTKMPLLDGRELTLSEVISEFKDGKTNYVYSLDSIRLRLVSTKILWAGVTRENAELLRIHISNGRSVDCTPDHKFVLGDGTEVEAQNLEVGSSLMSVPFEKGETPVFRDASRKSHKVALVEVLNEKKDTGDITVENDSHWFGLDAGIFVHNSMLEDYYFATTCIDLKTSIPLLDGRELTIEELISEYEEGKVNYTYSQNPEMQLEPGKIVWAGVTRRDTQVVRVHLDNDEYIDATPDHRFIMRDGIEAEAQNLKKDDSLMPLYLNSAKTSPKQKGKPYLRYIDNADGKMKWVHTAICPKTNPGKEYEIHHSDFNSLNNNPDNLVEMETAEHRQLHKDAGTYSIRKQWDNPESRQKLLDGIRRFHANRTLEDDKMLSKRNRANGKNSLAKIHKQRSLVFTSEMLDIFCIEYNSTNFQYNKQFANHLSTCLDFTNLFVKHNPSRYSARNIPISPTRITVENLNKMSSMLGYRNYTEFKKEYKYNHKVVSVEWLSETVDTGDITVETPSGNHIFATSAGVYVHNSDGRGSKVEVLPGGDNLGDIDDLRYFNNKMLRALGVPSSYLPTGPEDGSNPYSDGRVGTAFIQEFRFAKVCERYQRQVIKPLDQEFKLFLKHRGITIDSALFEINFTTPQSFSEYRQLELDAAQINVFGAIAEVPYISKRFALKRYLGWSEEEMNENERLWKEEKGVKKGKGVPEEEQGLSGAGITASGIEGMAPEGGFEEAGDEEFGDDEFADEAGDIGQDEIESFGEE